MLETWVRFLDWEDPLEKEMATHSSILAWEIPWTEEPGGLQPMGSQRVRHDLANEHTHTHIMPWMLHTKLTVDQYRFFRKAICRRFSSAESWAGWWSQLPDQLGLANCQFGYLDSPQPGLWLYDRKQVPLFRHFWSVFLCHAEKAMAPHSSTLAWKIPWMEEPGGLQFMGPLRVGHDWETSLSLFSFMHWRRKWQPTPVFLPGKSQGQGSLVGCRLWSCTESDTTEVT